MKTKPTLLIPIFFLLLSSCTDKNATPPPKPNVIFIMLDDFGFSQIAFNSNEISEEDYDPLFLEYVLNNVDYSPTQALEFSRLATPTISSLAEEGVIFDNAFATSNLCAPSRIGIATGIHQNRWGIYRNVDIERHGPKPGSLLVEKLKDAGYATAHIGKWHIGSRDQSMVPGFMVKHGIKDSAGVYPPLNKHPDVKKDLDEHGYMGSTIPEHHALNNGFDYYYGYNMWESPFYNATNVWDGFEHAGKNPTYNTDLFTEKAIAFISESISQNQPFYVQLHLHAVHAPLEPKAPDPYYNKFNSESFVLNNFYAHVFAVDENIRRLKNFLNEKGQAENTLFVFTSDNGGSIGSRSTLPGNAPYRGHKGMHLLGGIKVPMFFHWPAGIRVHERNHQLVSTLDILPTILDAAGIDFSKSMDGKTLLPYLQNASIAPVREHLLWSGIHARAWGFMSATAFNPPLISRELAPYAWVVVKDDYALRYTGETTKGLYKDIPEGLPAFYELYNIEEDPGEKNNLIGVKPEIFRDLKSIWDDEAQNFPAPFYTGRDKWEEIVPPNNVYLRK